MTLQELKDWITAAKYIDTINEFVDSCDNREYTKIFEKDGKFYKIEYMNKYPYNQWDDKKGFVRDQYAEPKEVKKISGMMYYATYVDLDKI